MDNKECKRCGLLKSTIEATDKVVLMCADGHDFGEDNKEEITPKEGVLGTWHMGHIALFGAILMSRGIIGKDKEMLKKMMYRALTAPNQIITNNN